MNIKDIINSKDYDFLRKNNIEKKLIFLTFGGSYAYGTNTENSDIDIRGVMFNNKNEILLLKDEEQYIDDSTDTVIYTFNKIIKLLSNCNPNTIEILGCKKEDYIITSKIGQELIDNYDMFLSKKAINSFGGYANAQLRRLQNAMSSNSTFKIKKEEHILGTLENMIYDLNNRYHFFKYGDINISLCEDRDNKEVCLSGYLHKYPLRDYINMYSELRNVIKEYEKIGRRNNKKDLNHLSKHMMHLVRLYLMCFDILENKKIVTNRSKDKDFLMKIRNGYYLKNDTEVADEFFEIVNELEKRLQYDAKNTDLPENPDYKKIEDFQMYVNEYIVRNMVV